MKLNDYKEKIQEENYDIPNVLNKIKLYAENKNYHQKIEKKSNFSLIKKFTIIMSCIAMFCIIGIVVLNKDINKQTENLNYEIGFIEDKKITDLLTINSNITTVNRTIKCTKNSATSSEKIETMNCQIKEIEEDDFVKYDEEYIYNLYANEITIYSYNENNIDYFKTLTIDDDIKYNSGTLHIKDHYLIAIFMIPSNKTEVLVYDKNQNFQKTFSYIVDGELVDTRLFNDSFILITAYGITNDLDKPKFIIENVKTTINSKEILYVRNALNNSYVIISNLKFNDYITVDQSCLLGSDEIKVYMNDLYLCLFSNRMINSELFTTIYVYNIYDEIDFDGIIQEKGEINDQYSIDEYLGNLRIFLHDQSQIDEDVNKSNHLLIFDLSSKDENTKKYNLIGSIKQGIGEPNHIITTTYFKNEFAYVVTYLEDDPLYEINLGNPKSPQIVREIVAPGYSEYLYEFANNRMIGIGYEDDKETPKISLYQTVNDTEELGVSVKLSDYCNQNVMYNFEEHKELFVLNNQNIIGIPVVTFDDEIYETKVLIFKLNEERLQSYKEFIVKQNIKENSLYLNFSKKNNQYGLYKKTSYGWHLVENVLEKDVSEYKNCYPTSDYDITCPLLDLVLEVKNDKIKGYEISRYSIPVQDRNSLENREYSSTYYQYELRRVLFVNGYYIGVTALGLVIYDNNYNYLKTIYTPNK